MERLTELADFCFDDCGYESRDAAKRKCRFYKNCYQRQVYDKLKVYEILEEQGLLLKLPCKVGDTVWNIRCCDEKEESVLVNGKQYFRKEMKHKVSKDKFSIYDYYDLGETVFLTREEAEKKLKELEGK